MNPPSRKLDVFLLPCFALSLSRGRLTKEPGSCGLRRPLVSVHRRRKSSSDDLIIAEESYNHINIVVCFQGKV